MIGRDHHLQEERLFDCYLVERRGEALDPPAADHLADCADCGARYADLARFMDGLRADADAETDQIFPADRLRAQQQQILRRIEHLARPARVIDFPGRFVSRHLMPSGARGVTRWVYAAAAAGLVIGVGLGAVYQSEWAAIQSGRRSAVHQIGSARPRLTPAGVTGATLHEAADDAFLSDLEAALERPHTRSLQPFDALTPHVRDVADRSQ